MDFGSHRLCLLVFASVLTGPRSMPQSVQPFNLAPLTRTGEFVSDGQTMTRPHRERILLVLYASSVQAAGRAGSSFYDCSSALELRP